MSIKSASILSGATSVAASGGTATTMIDKGTTDKTTVILDDSSEFALQTKMEFSVVDPAVSSGAPNGYTQARAKARLLKPLLLDNGNYTTNTGQVQFSWDPETTAAERTEMRYLLAQAIVDSDYDEFYNNNSLA